MSDDDIRRRRKRRQKKEKEKEQRIQNALQQRLRDHPMLPLEIILNPDSYPGENEAGEKWDLWAVEVSEAAALAVVARADYRERPGLSEAHTGELMCRAVQKWEAAGRAALERFPETLALAGSRGRTVLSALVQPWERLALEVMRRPELARQPSAPGQPSVGFRAVEHWKSAARYLITEGREQASLYSQPNRSVYALVAARYGAEPDFGDKLLRAVGENLEEERFEQRSVLDWLFAHGRLVPLLLANFELAALRLRSGRTPAHDVVTRSEKAALLMTASVRFAELRDGKGRSVAHEAVRCYETVALKALAIAQPEVARLRDHQGWSVAHEVARRWPEAAKQAVANRELARLQDHQGRSVLEVAREHQPSLRVAFHAMRARLEALLGQAKGPEEERREEAPGASLHPRR